MAAEDNPVAAPARRFTYTARIERIFDHNADTRSLFLTIESGGQLRFVAGQFISISIALPNETRVRPYTIASSPDNRGPLEIVFNQVAGGEGVSELFRRKVGNALTFTGPFGAFTMDSPPAAETIFIAHESTIAPIRPMIHFALKSPEHQPLTLLYAARDDAHLLYRGEIDGWVNSGLRFASLLADSAALDRRLIDEVHTRWIDADRDRTRQFYICGVGSGVYLMRSLLRDAGYERRAVHCEKW